jgi:hypothetical protein
LVPVEPAEYAMIRSFQLFTTLATEEILRLWEELYLKLLTEAGLDNPLKGKVLNQLQVGLVAGHLVIMAVLTEMP